MAEFKKIWVNNTKTTKSTPRKSAMLEEIQGNSELHVHDGNKNNENKIIESKEKNHINYF